MGHRLGYVLFILVVITFVAMVALAVPGCTPPPLPADAIVLTGPSTRLVCVSEDLHIPGIPDAIRCKLLGDISFDIRVTGVRQ